MDHGNQRSMVQSINNGFIFPGIQPFPFPDLPGKPGFKKQHSKVFTRVQRDRMPVNFLCTRIRSQCTLAVSRTPSAAIDDGIWHFSLDPNLQKPTRSIATSSGTIRAGGICTGSSLENVVEHTYLSLWICVGFTKHVNPGGISDL